MGSILEINELEFKQPDALSLVKQRTQVKQAFEFEDIENLKGSEVMRCSWSTGESMIDVTKSYLSFIIQVNGTETTDYWSFGKGSGMNIFREIVVRSNSGVELCRLQEPSLWSSICFKNSTNISQKKSIGSLMGFETQTSSVSPQYRDPYFQSDGLTLNKYKIVIPLKYLSPLFKNIEEQRYLPSQLCEGLYFEFHMNNKERTLYVPQNPENVSSVDITKFEFVLDACIMNDQTQKEINNKSNSQGLQWVCKGNFNNRTSYSSGETHTNNQVYYSASNVERAYSVFIASEEKLDNDNFYLYPLCNRFQYRSGAEYFPKEVLQDVSQQNISSTYFQNLLSFDKVGNDENQGSNLSLKEFTDGSVCYSCNLNNSDSLYLSGTIINNSKSLEFVGDYSETTPFDYHVFTFIDYVKVIDSQGRSVSVAN